MLGNAVLVFVAIFLAELPDKTMFATLMLSTRMRRPLAVWIGVSIGYCTHVTVAVLFGSALSKLPERPIHAVVGFVFFGSRILMFRSSQDKQEKQDKIKVSRNLFQVVYISTTVILVAEFADLTQLATVGFAVTAGAWLQRKVKLQLVQRAASVFFINLGILSLFNSIFSST